MINDVLMDILEVVESVDPVLRIIIATVAIMLETSVLIGLIVPGDTIVIVAATAVSSVPEGVILASCLVVGSLVGETVGYALGWWLGPRIRHSRFGAWLGEHNWQRAERYLDRRGGIAIFLSRFLPVLHSLVPLTVGMSRFPYRTFLAWTVPACMVWSGLYVTIAASAAAGFREIASSAHYAGYLFVGAIVVFVAAIWLVKRSIQRAERKHMEERRDTGPLPTV